MSLNVIALISGGKDSMFSMLHCADLGHKIIALANLYPPVTPVAAGSDPSEEDLNSFMFQTAGHGIIPLYEKALGLPLFRQQISGHARHTSKEYAPSAVMGDETEDLFALLSDVKKKHPEANAVSTGAILSTYQRTRVESVALRLGLVPLGYLWQYPVLPPDLSPASLLQHMAVAGIDARIVKIASGGLDESFLWQNVCDAKTIRRLEKAMSRFGGSILGEGGEFETLVVSGPSPIWKQRLVINSDQMMVVKSGGGEAFLDFKGGSVEPLPGTSFPFNSHHQMFDDQFRDLLERPKLLELCQARTSSNLSRPQPPSACPSLEATCLERDGIVHVNNISGHSQETQMESHQDGPAQSSLIDQSQKACAALLQRLSDIKLDASSILQTTILLRSMSDFLIFNKVYGELFKQSLPPARVTIACGDRMPSDIHIILSAFAHTRNIERRGLHVQTRSHWAPANIGPYSQARSLPTADGHDVVFVAGQIPLVPSRMQSYEPETGNDLTDFAHSAALSLQHLWRIGTEQRVGFWTGTVAYIAACDDFEAKAQIARRIWIEAHWPPPKADTDGDEDEGEEADFDIWNQRNIIGSRNWASTEEQARSIPDFDHLVSRSSTDHLEWPVPGFFAVEVAGLPRDCPVEWQSTGLAPTSDEQGYSLKHGTATTGRLFETRVSALANLSLDGEEGSSFTYLEMRNEENEIAYSDATASQHDGLSATVYTTASMVNLRQFGDDARIIPCNRIIGLSGNSLEGAAIVQKMR